jgi:hypothetical protein
MVPRMPGESPQRDWNALLAPPPESFVEAVAAAQARHQRKMRARAWSWFAYVIIGLTFIGWLALAPYFVRSREAAWQWLTSLIWFVVLLPAMLFIIALILRRLERLVLPSAERELAGES